MDLSYLRSFFGNSTSFFWANPDIIALSIFWGPPHIQLHLISPKAPYYQGADVLLTADCVAYALGDYHRQYLKGKGLAIACPKLDEGQDIYVQKIKAWIDEAKINTLTVMIMQVPCCMGLLSLAQEAAQNATRKVPIKYLVVGLQGEILQEEWV